MRAYFDEQLKLLNDSLIEMGALIENAIAKAAKALENQDAELAKEVIAGDGRIDDKNKEIESLCLKLLLNQQPVASDLRQVSTALKMITDMERIGDHASDISEICIYLSKNAYIKKPLHVVQMASETVKMVTNSIDAYVRSDLELARAVIEQDNIVDELFLVVKNELIAHVHEDVEKGEQAFDMLQIAKYFEKIGDHAENIAEWVIFSITGMHKNTQVF